MQPTSENSVAKILKTYGVLNGSAGTILGVSVACNLETSIGLICIAVALVASFGIYAFGEVISLLSDIRANTGANASASAPTQPEACDNPPEL